MQVSNGQIVRGKTLLVAVKEGMGCGGSKGFSRATERRDSPLSSFLCSDIHFRLVLSLSHAGRVVCLLMLSTRSFRKSLPRPSCFPTIPLHHQNARRRGCGTFLTAPLLLNGAIAC